MFKIIAISGWKRSGKDTAANFLIEHGYTRISFADPLKDMVAKEYGIPREHCDDPDFKESPILHLPVTPKDTFSLMLAKLMYKELRTEQGKIPVDFHVDTSGAFLGVINRAGAFTENYITEQLYHTPRSLCILKGSVNRFVQTDYWVQTAVDQINWIKDNGPLTNAVTGKVLADGVVISDLRYKSELTQLRQAFGKNLITVRVNRFDTSPSQDPSERDLDDGTFDVVIDNKGSIEDFINKVKELL